MYIICKFNDIIRKIKSVIASYMICLLVLFIFNSCSTSRWIEKATTQKGETININFFHSELIGFCWFPHTRCVGYGGDTYEIRFEYNDIKYSWNSRRDERPFILEKGEKGFYLAVYDRTDLDRECCDFKFYCSNFSGKFFEIPAKDFPIYLAIQNLWLADYEKELLKKFDSNNSHFRSSLTATVWSKIYDLNSFNDKEITKEFADKIINQHFSNRLK